MTKSPVQAPGIQPGLEKHPRFRKSIAAARSRAAAVAPGETLIDRISDADWNDAGAGTDTTARAIAAVAQ